MKVLFLEDYHNKGKNWANPDENGQKTVRRAAGWLCFSAHLWLVWVVMSYAMLTAAVMSWSPASEESS